MMNHKYRWIIGVVSVLLLPFVADWAVANARLSRVEMTVTPDPPSVVADGKSQTILTLRVTENGKPRSNDLIQAWIEIGGGLLRPQWVYTDENGMAEIMFAPNPKSPYDVENRATIHITDTSIGHLLEVKKHLVVDIPLGEPQEQQEQETSIIG